MRFRDGWFFQGNCLDIMPKLPAGSVDMVLCDLPYGTTQNKWDAVIPFEPLWAAYRTLCVGAFVLTAQQPFTSALVTSNLKGFRQALVWSKNKASGHLNAQRRHLTAHEDVLVFCDAQTIYNPQRTPGHKTRSGWKRGSNTENYGAQRPTEYAGTDDTRAPTTVLNISVVNNDGSSDGGRIHPTQKPVELFEYLIRTYTNPGGTVLDNTAGSGTTAIAAMRSGRRFICIEQDEKYYAAACERVRAEEQNTKRT